MASGTPARYVRGCCDDAGHLIRAHVLDLIAEREHAAELLFARSTYSAALARLVAE